ncbi:MAG TPA: alpha/beta hydrolase [Bacteroidia bacterium]
MKLLQAILISFILWIISAFQTLNAANVPYGNNPATGKTIVLNGVKHYYETYGSGKPMLLIHGNLTGISGWGAQIEYFSKTHKVYAIDCRARGKSDIGKDTLTYEGMAHDMAEFISQLKLDSVSVIGKSDGAIVALIMGYKYSQHLKNIVAFSANIRPDSSALISTSIKEIHEERAMAEKKISEGDTSNATKVLAWRNRLMEFHPHITGEMLSQIKIPVLILTADRDLVKLTHSIEIYQAIPLAHLCVLNGANHFVAKQDPNAFNLSVMKFLQEGYRDEQFRFKR